MSDKNIIIIGGCIGEAGRTKLTEALRDNLIIVDNEKGLLEKTKECKCDIRRSLLSDSDFSLNKPKNNKHCYPKIPPKRLK